MAGGPKATSRHRVCHDYNLRSEPIHRVPSIMTGIFSPSIRWRIDGSSLYFRISRRDPEAHAVEFSKTAGPLEDGVSVR